MSTINLNNIFAQDNRSTTNILPEELIGVGGVISQIRAANRRGENEVVFRLAELAPNVVETLTCCPQLMVYVGRVRQEVSVSW